MSDEFRKEKQIQSIGQLPVFSNAPRPHTTPTHVVSSCQQTRKELGLILLKNCYTVATFNDNNDEFTDVDILIRDNQIDRGKYFPYTRRGKDR